MPCIANYEIDILNCELKIYCCKRKMFQRKTFSVFIFIIKELY